MTLITVWHGAKWRDEPAPTLAAPEPPQAPRAKATRDDVWHSTSDTWQSTTQVVIRSGCGDKSTRLHLAALVQAGRLEMRETRTKAQRGGAPARWYRRRQDG